MKTRQNIFLLFSIILFLSNCSNPPDNKVLIGELTNGSFDNGPKFNSDFTFTWEVNNDLNISGNYRIGKIYKNENKVGYVALRRLSWVITFSNVSNSDYWDKDNSMNLHYTWNHSKADKMFELKGSSIYYPISFYKDVDGNKLIQKYWDNSKELEKPKTSKSSSNEESIAAENLQEMKIQEQIEEIILPYDLPSADNVTIVEEVTSIETASISEDNNDYETIYKNVVKVESFGMFDGNYSIYCIDTSGEKIKLYIQTSEMPEEPYFSPIYLDSDLIEGKTFNVSYSKRNWLENLSNGELDDCYMLMSCEPYSLD